MRNTTSHISPISICFSYFFPPNQALKSKREKVNYRKHYGDVSLGRLFLFNQQSYSYHRPKMPTHSQHQLARILRELLLECIIGRPKFAEKNHGGSKQHQLQKSGQNPSLRIGFEGEVLQGSVVNQKQGTHGEVSVVVLPEIVNAYPCFKLANFVSFY